MASSSCSLECLGAKFCAENIPGSKGCKKALKKTEVDPFENFKRIPIDFTNATLNLADWFLDPDYRKN